MELDETIASPANPLTARVLVNRVWAHHFGKPLVATPSDFGVRGALPTHPGASGLPRGHIQCRAAGRSSGCTGRSCSPASISSPATATPLPRQGPGKPPARPVNRQRMEFEPLRDTLLQLSGSLDTTVGGRPVQRASGDNNRRNDLCLCRPQDLPGLLRTFDFADRGAHSPQRKVTTVPQQSLFLMNSPFVLEQVRGLLARPDATARPPPPSVSARCSGWPDGRAPEGARNSRPA